MKDNLEIKYLKEDELIPYINNTRTHSPEQIEKLKSSIKEYGMATPIGIHNNTIVYGHARFTALKELGYTEFPTVDLSYMTEAQMKGYIISDNRLAMDAGWDNELLKIEIEALHDMDFDIDLLGFDAEELEELDIHFDDIPLVVDEDNADDVPEIVENPCIRGGDLIELGMNFQHRVLCGDSTIEDNVIRLMDGKKADMVFTDPPYGVDFQSNMRTKSDKFDVLKNDDVFLDGWVELVNKYSKGFVFVWTSWKVVNKWIDICKPIGNMSNMIIWFKGGGGIGDLKKTFSSDYEIALVYHRNTNIQDKRLGSVWQVGKDGASDYAHPTQKPVELMEKGIFNCSKTKQIIMDLFLGSGTTLIASENLTRKCYGMELDEKYAQVVVQRYVDYTSIDTIKINGVETSWEAYKNANT